MAYSEQLAETVRDVIGPRPGIVEKKMFGGIAILLNGNMACGISGESLMVRMAPEDTAAALEKPGVRIFDMTGRPMKGWLLVDVDSTDAAAVEEWVDVGMDFAATLPSK